MLMVVAAAVVFLYNTTWVIVLVSLGPVFFGQWVKIGSMSCGRSECLV